MLKSKLMSQLRLSLNSEELFEVFVSIYGKHYIIGSAEADEKFKNFESSLKFIKENTRPDVQFTLTNYSDMSPEEFKAHVTNKKLQYTASVKQAHLQQTNTCKSPDLKCSLQSDYPGKNNVSVDWKDKLLPPRNQGSCGSCWAFATLAAIEGNNAIEGFSNQYLSVQELVDCSKNNEGCDGGYPSSALEHVMQNGIGLDSSYPYNAVEEACPAIR